MPDEKNTKKIACGDVVPGCQFTATAATEEELVKQVVNDPQVDVSYGARDARPPTPAAELDSDAFTALEGDHTQD